MIAPLRLAGDLTASEHAMVQPVLADTDTFASSANSQNMARIAALSRIDMIYGMHLKYLWYNLWSSEEEANFGNALLPPCLVDWTKYANPLPAVLEKELANAKAMKTIRENPDLFKIITPINVDQFEELLKSHPNRPFVESICRGL